MANYKPVSKRCHSRLAKIVCTPEILSSLLSANCDSRDAVLTDPKAFIFSHYNISLNDDLDFFAVSNNADYVNLALPYYSNLQVDAERVSDESMADIIGGDLILLTAVVLSVFAGTGVTVAGGVVTGAVLLNK